MIVDKKGKIFSDRRIMERRQEQEDIQKERRKRERRVSNKKIKEGK